MIRRLRAPLILVALATIASIAASLAGAERPAGYLAAAAHLVLAVCAAFATRRAGPVARWSLAAAFVLLAAGAIYLTEFAVPRPDSFVPTEFLTADLGNNAAASLSAEITDEHLVGLILADARLIDSVRQDLTAWATLPAMAAFTLALLFLRGRRTPAADSTPASNDGPEGKAPPTGSAPPPHPSARPPDPADPASAPPDAPGEAADSASARPPDAPGEPADPASARPPDPAGEPADPASARPPDAPGETADSASALPAAMAAILPLGVAVAAVATDPAISAGLAEVAVGTLPVTLGVVAATVLLFLALRRPRRSLWAAAGALVLAVAASVAFNDAAGAWSAAQQATVSTGSWVFFSGAYAVTDTSILAAIKPDFFGAAFTAITLVASAMIALGIAREPTEPS